MLNRNARIHFMSPPCGRFPVTGDLGFLEAFAIRYVKPGQEKLRDHFQVVAGVH